MVILVFDSDARLSSKELIKVHYFSTKGSPVVKREAVSRINFLPQSTKMYFRIDSVSTWNHHLSDKVPTPYKFRPFQRLTVTSHD